MLSADLPALGIAKPEPISWKQLLTRFISGGREFNNWSRRSVPHDRNVARVERPRITAVLSLVLLACGRAYLKHAIDYTVTIKVSPSRIPY
jgi:hypothetical protein